MLRIEDLGELAYGGLVTGSKRWDEGRGIAPRDMLRHAGFYAYVVPGAICTLSTVMNWMPQWSAWHERIAHGFIYGFPNFVMEVVDAFSEPGVGRSAVSQAERILASKTRVTRRQIGQTSKPGFEDVEIY